MAKVTITGLSRNYGAIKKAVEKSCLESMKICMKDLGRVASETTPYDEGDLEMAYTHEAKKVSDGVVGSVEFAVYNEDFNYAIWIHEETYNLGEKSKEKAAGGGGVGLSGATYPVGRKYLTRPFEGEAETYRDIIEDNLAKDLGWFSWYLWLI